MKKDEFLKMMWQDNETESEPKKTICASIIECIEIALSYASDGFEVASNKNLKEIYGILEEQAKQNATKDANGRMEVGVISPFEAAKIICKYLGVDYEPPAKSHSYAKPKVNLNDFFD